MRRRPRNHQPDLFPESTLAPPIGREKKDLYRAVLYTRIFKGKSCLRAGVGKHLVGGRQITSAQLVAGMPQISDLVFQRLGVL